MSSSGGKRSKKSCAKDSSSYEECILTAVGLGDDTNTVAAIAGGLAGIYYGYEAIPATWVRSLRNKEFIVSVCEKWDSK